MRTVTLHQPEHLVCGSGCLAECGEHLRATTRGRALIVTSPSNGRHAEMVAERLPGAHIDVQRTDIREPTSLKIERGRMLLYRTAS